MTKNSSNSPLINGFLYVGGLLALQFLISTFQIGWLNSLSFFAITAFIVYLLYKVTANYREEYCDGAISYGNALWFIFRICIFGTAISAFVIFIYCQFINTELLEQAAEVAVDIVIPMYKQYGIDINEETLSITPFKVASVWMFVGIFPSLFWALIIAAFVKKDKSIFSENQ